jgi:hypothetical protein
LGTLLGFIEANYADPDYETRVLTPLEDFFTVTAGNTGTSLWLIINPVTAFTTGTLQLPPASSATNDQEITVVFTAGVTDLTVASDGATVLGAPIRIGAYDSFRVRYNAGQLKWYTLDTTGDGSGSVASILRQDFAGDGVTTNFTLAVAPPAFGETLQIFIDGVYQERAGYSIAGAFLIFSAPPPNGTVIEVLSWDALSSGATTADLVGYNRDSGGVLTTVSEELDRTTTINVTAYELGTTAAASSHAGIITGHIIRTNYFDSARTAGSGAEHSYTGVTTLGKAGNWPDADGYFYDADGKQFEVAGSPVNPLWFGAVGDDSADDSSKLQIVFDFVANNSLSLDMGSLTYKITTSLVITAPCNNWSIFGYSAELKQYTSNTPCITFNMDSGNIFQVAIRGIAGRWNAQQTAANTASNFIYVHSATAAGNTGFYNNEIADYGCYYGYGGVVLGDDCIIWGCSFIRQVHNFCMGPPMDLRANYSGGMPNNKWDMAYINSNDAVGAVATAFFDSQSGFSVNNIEWNRTIGVVLTVTNSKTVDIGTLRVEASAAATAAFTPLFRFDGSSGVNVGQIALETVDFPVVANYSPIIARSGLTQFGEINIQHINLTGCTTSGALGVIVYGYDEKGKINIGSVNDGTILAGYPSGKSSYNVTIREMAGAKRNVLSQGISANIGDSNYILEVAGPDVIKANTPLTANRTITLPVGIRGSSFKVYRTTSATGAFNLDVGGVKNLAVGQWCEMMYGGAAWEVIAFGSL